MRMKRIRSILPLGYYIKAKREEVAAESEREPITAQPEDKQQDKPEDKSQDKERRKHPGRQTLPAHLELVEHVRLATRTTALNAANINSWPSGTPGAADRSA